MRDNPGNILIILMGSLGDVVRGLSLVDEIKSAWPDTRITWLVEPTCEPIVSLHPRINKIIIFNRKNWMAALPGLISELRKNKFDLVLIENRK